MHRRLLHGLVKAVIHHAGGLHSVVEDLLRFFAHGFEVRRIQHQAHARLVGLQRDHPEPGVLTAHDQDVAILLTLRHVHALEVAEDGDLLVPGIVFTAGLAVGREVGQAAGIHEKGAFHLHLRAFSVLVANADMSVMHLVFQHRRFLTHFGTVFAGVIQQQLVKLRALHLHSSRKFGERTFGEIETHLVRAIAHQELRPTLGHEACGLDLFPHSEIIEDLAVVRQQGLTHVEAWKLHLFQHQNFPASLRQRGGGCRPSRTATNDDGVVGGAGCGGRSLRVGHLAVYC